MIDNFNIGDEVTFNAFHGEFITAKIVEKLPEAKYRLEGINKPLTSITSGRSIVESNFYKVPPEKFEW